MDELSDEEVDVSQKIKKGIVIDLILVFLGLVAFFIAPLASVLTSDAEYGSYLAILLLPFTYAFVVGLFSIIGFVGCVVGLAETFLLLSILGKKDEYDFTKRINFEDRSARSRKMLRIGSILLIVSSLIAIPLMQGLIGGLQ
ncbi:MAG: hypothetical protein ACTSQF_00430 [Candidatus Heimdallarchaeaceae archaeon]